MAPRYGYTSEVEFPQCSQDGELIVHTSRGDCSLTPNSLGLKIFQVRGNNYNQVIGDKSRELVWLRWFDPGQRNLPSLSTLKKLKVLELNEGDNRDYHLEELWETDSDGPVQLRQLVISGCRNFRGFPKSIGCLQSLEHLKLNWCANLSSLPSNFGDLRNLRHLDLSYCYTLRSLPDSFKNLTLLQHLCLYICPNLALESDILENMTKVEYLNLSGCRQLEELPRHITNQASLRELDLEDTCIREIPLNISQLSKLQKFNVGCKLLTSMPTSLGDLSSLATLRILGCPNLESLPSSLGDLSSLTTLIIDRCPNLESLPTSLGDLSSLTTLYILECSKLESLPTSIGNLSSLTALSINGCSKLEFLPDSVGRLGLLENLFIRTPGLKSLPFSQTQVMVGSPISGLDPGVGVLNSSLRNLKWIHLVETQVSKISISEDCCPSLERIELTYNEHLTEIEVLPSTVKQLLVHNCGMLRNISGIVGLVNIKELIITGCSELDALPSFAELASLRVFKLKGWYGVEKIQGLEHCRALEELTAETRWKEAGTESLEVMERLRRLQLTAISRSAVEGCIPSMQKWREEIIVCTRAVPDSGSLLDSFVFTNLSVIDSISNHSISNQTMNSYPTLKLSSSNAQCILLCFVVNCNSPQVELQIRGGMSGRIKLEEGKWVLICVFTQRSRWHIFKEFLIIPSSWHTLQEYDIIPSSWGEDEVERGMVVVGEEERVVEAFHSLWALLSN